MKKQLIKLGYNITTDSQFQNNRCGITPELAKQLEKLGYEALEKNNKKIINKLTQLITDHPMVPLLKNYLSVAYHTQGNYDKAVEINNRILAEHPDYLFARLNKANVYIENSEFEKVSEVLGEAMEIKLLYF